MHLARSTSGQLYCELDQDASVILIVYARTVRVSEGHIYIYIYTTNSTGILQQRTRQIDVLMVNGKLL
jgi:hypothetical protein